MSLLRLDIADFRNLNSVKIEPIACGFNYLYGSNGSGKTSFLEAIYYLSRSRSFRSGSVGHIINHAAEKFSIFSQILTQNQQIVPVGIERQRDGSSKIRVLGQENSSPAELVELTPTLLMNSSCFNLLEGGPVFRRKYLDWGAFYLSKEFLPAWKLYERTLKQRNAALREQRPKKEIEVWGMELVKCATSLNALRQAFIAKLMPIFQALLTELIEIPGLKLNFYPGWDERLSYQEAMAQFGDKDISAGYTQLGPHRADFKISINHVPVKDILSRGQQKLFICAMIVGQGTVLYEGANRRCIYLLDDLPSELDSNSRSRLMTLLAKQNAQVFVTAIERKDWVNRSQAPMKMFHVEHGGVKEDN